MVWPLSRVTVLSGATLAMVNDALAHLAIAGFCGGDIYHALAAGPGPLFRQGAFTGAGAPQNQIGTDDEISCVHG